MKTPNCFAVFVALFGALFTISTSAAGQAVQWTQAEGGNGNWYEAVDIDSTYHAARSYCEDLGGHLVSLTSADEDTWVYTNLDGGDARWIGAYQDINSPEYSEPNGGWGWVSGEAWSYTNWNGDGPDNNDLSVPDEEAGHYCCGGAWNDLYEVKNGSPVERKFIMEWSADCNDDGMVDYGQILNGELTDNDGNGVPDICEPITVDDDGLDDPDADFDNIQDAINASSDGDAILVMPGTYTSNGNSVITLPNHGISIIGSGGAATTIVDGQDARRGLIGNGGGDNGTVIEGLTFQHGRADNGGGLYLFDCDPTIRNCIILENNATQDGGGIFCRRSDPVIENSTIEKNISTQGGGGFLCWENCSPFIANTTFAENTSTSSGGGGFFAGNDSSFTLTDCTFDSNTASTSSGAASIQDSTGQIATCTFNANSAPMTGGALTIYDGPVSVTNSVFTGNTSGDGGAIRFFTDCDVTLDGCTFNNNLATDRGGALFLTINPGAIVDVKNCNIHHNVADGHPDGFGGGIAGGGWNGDDTEPKLENTVVCQNIPDQIDGEGSYQGYVDNGGNTVCELQQWRVEDGGNGNWYERFSVAQIDWTEAAAAADNQGGYLATMTSVEENAFITSSFPLVDSGPGYWLGGTKEGTGQWQWVTGESWSYEAWNQGDCHPSMQPSDVEGRDYLDMFCQQGDVAYWSNDWDDWTGSLGYVVEWSADCNGDGIVDYGQILSGELADDDGNGVPDVCEECPGDIIEDGVVDLIDFTAFLVNFGATGENIADLNGDLVVDLNDFSIFLVNYGNVCETRSAVADTGLGKVAPTHHIGGVPRRSMN